MKYYLLLGNPIWTEENTKKVKTIFADYIEELACPGKAEVESRIKRTSLSNIPYRQVVYKINSMIQTIKRRRM